MLRKAIELVRRAGLQAYHGSDEPDIEELAAFKPNYQHGGDIGYGVYVSENYDTAAFYGKYVYVLDLNLDHGDIFDLSAENQYQVEGYEGESVLVGEFVPPFYFLVGDKKYLVSNTDYDIGAALRAKEMLIESLESSGLDILAPLVREHDGLPSIDDIEWHLDDVAESEGAQAAIMQQVAPMVSAAEAWFEANEAIVVDLDEIGSVVEEAGYKALYFERGGTVGDEILVFDPANVRIVEKVTKTSNLKQAIQLVADLTDLDALKSYLTMSDVDKGRDLAANFGQDFMSYLEGAGEEELAALVQAEIEKNEVLDWPFLETLPDKAFEGFYEHLPAHIRDDPQSPTYLFMDFTRDVDNEWLIHGTNDAGGIEANGFTRGVWDLATLGLTRGFVDKVKTGGFNFAFYATSFHESDVLAYGKEAVVFRASGVEVYHHGDQQRQIIFLGNTATDIHRIIYYSGSYYANINDVEFEGTLEECADWIMENA